MVPIVAVVAYTSLLMILGRRRATSNVENYRDGGHRFSAWTVWVLVTALWSSSIIAVEIDTAYRMGVSAAWYGVSVALMSVLVSLLLPVFRRMGYVSNSDLLGSRFGLMAKRLSGLVIATTFPIFALSNALAAAAFLHVAVGWPLWLSVSLTTAILVGYIQFAGMLSLAATQSVNLLLMFVGTVLFVWKMTHLSLPTAPAPAYFWKTLGPNPGLIWVWFGMNTLNVFSAQAEIQAVAAAKNVRAAQRAVWISSLVLLAIIGVSTWAGIEARLVAPHAPSGLIAFAAMMLYHSPLWMKTGVALGMWAMALTWCGPLLFSGSVSLGGDVLPHRDTRRAMRLALALEGLLLVLYALWRPGEVAWWRVFGLTLRNAAVVGPTVALLLWDDLPGSTVVLSMISGIAVGLGLNAWTGFSPTYFVGGINPMWAAASTTFAVLATARLLSCGRYRCMAVTFGAWVVLMAGSVKWGQHFLPGGLAGIMVLLAGLAATGTAWYLTQNAQRRWSQAI